MDIYKKMTIWEHAKVKFLCLFGRIAHYFFLNFLYLYNFQSLLTIAIPFNTVPVKLRKK